MQVDGQLKTGRDVIIQALLGAEEFGFATSAPHSFGLCHDAQMPPEYLSDGCGYTERRVASPLHRPVRNTLSISLLSLAQEVREWLAEMGFTRMDDIIGRSDLLVPQPPVGDHTIDKLDLSRILYRPAEAEKYACRKVKEQSHNIEDVIDQRLIKAALPTLKSLMPIELHLPICNTDRSVGAMLSGEIASRFGNEGLPDDTIRCNFSGSAGQSFGAFLAHGVTFSLAGEANDYLGKGLSGGKIIVVPPKGSTFAPEENIIAGNTLLYGATSGEVYINGRVGERFCVRNSGAIAVVEGVGDHCCEYMTGGRTVVLGSVGRNFAAGMSGGIAYVWNKDENFDFFCNMEMVELSLIEDTSDNKELHRLIARHYEFTESPLALRMLENWEEYVQQFIKVMPIEYKKVMNEEKMKLLQQKIANVERDY